MQGDLISRSVLIEAIVNTVVSETVSFNTAEELIAYLNGCVYRQNEIIDTIKEQPTEYSVEKVVAELEEKFSENPYVRDIAIKCVRNGGKE